MKTLKAIWTAITRALRGRYVRMLEEEISRLRAENRALTDSLLGTAGFPPLALNESTTQKSAEAPTRRRSWPQIAMMREREATRQAAKREAYTRQN